MQNKKAFINIITSAGQVLLIGLIYYFLYKFLLNELGVKKIGVWSIVMSTSSIANIADLGIATSMVRFVSLYEHRNNFKRLPSLIFTGVVLNVILFVGVALIIWPIAYYLLGNIIEPEFVDLSRQLLPFSLICILLNSISGVYGSILDGFRKNYIRNTIYTFSSVVFFVTSIFTVKSVGVIGVVWCQVLQSLLSLSLCLFFAVKIAKFNPLKLAWSKNIFKEIFSYGLKFQLTSITGILNEPVTKMLISKFGGLAFAGYYEMANKLVMQVRGAIVSANQSLMPYMVKESEQNHTNSNKYSVLSYSFFGVVVISIIIFSNLNILAPTISKLWIGHTESIFINVLGLVSLSMFINLLSAPCYFAFLSANKLNPIIISQSIMAFINLLLGFVLGYFFGGYGIVVTWTIVVIVGSFYLIKALGMENVTQVLSKYKTYIIFFFLINVFCVFFSYLFTSFNYLILIVNIFATLLITYILLNVNKVNLIRRKS